MPQTANGYGEVHCLLCGRNLAEIVIDADGIYRLRRPISAQDPRDGVRVVRGKLHCARCGGRAFVEWDLMPSGQVANAA